MCSFSFIGFFGNVNMKKINLHVVLFVVSTAFASFVPLCAANSAKLENNKDKWHYFVNLAYSSRELSGEVVSKTVNQNDAFGELVATGDSMNVGSSNGLMLAAGAQYKKWALGLSYLPTSFNGSGSAIVAVGSGSSAVLQKTPLETDIEINMILANGSYKVIETKHSVFGVGAGMGYTAIDLNIVPEVGSAIDYKGNQPFGFLNMHMLNMHDKFIYGFSLNGISAAFDGVNVNYSDYKIDLGYQLDNKKYKTNIVWGYRMVNFAIDIESEGKLVKTDVRLEGPFIGVVIAY